MIGSGRVARAFAMALGGLSRAPALMLGRSADHVAEALAAAGGGEAAQGYAALAARCDLIVIAVSDDALATVVADLAAAGPMARAPLVVHVSGQKGDAILAPLRAAGALSAAIHPAMTFTGQAREEVRRMIGAPFAVTAESEAALVRACALVERLGGKAVPVAEADRTLYHAALCHAANHLVTLIAQANRMLEAAGADDPHGLLAPLVRAALDNSLSSGFAALSGPLLRGDEATIEGHIVALESRAPDMLPTYSAMARATLGLLEEQGQDTAPTLRALLADDGDAPPP